MIERMTSELNERGGIFLKAIDISSLSYQENRGFNVAVLIAKPLSPNYLKWLTSREDMDKTIFKETEKDIDKIGEWVEHYLISKGYESFAQTEDNLLKNGCYDSSTKCTSLPHKKIATIGGVGWIGKNNLLCTQDYGNALCLCSILTNAPLETESNPTIIESLCGKCTKCKDVCPTSAISGVKWSLDTSRDDLIDVYNCITCLKCLVLCPWTQKYIKGCSD